MSLRSETQHAITRRLLALHADKTTEMAPAPLRNPASDYTDPAQFALEQRKLFRDRPIVACLSVDVAAPGAYVATESGGVPIVVVRDEAGVLRAFVNICRHRASILLDGAGQLSRSIVCGFHGWTYGLDGQLLAQPFACGGFDSIDCSTLSLRPIAVAECAGLVFVRPGSAAAIDIAATLGGLEDELGDYHFDGFHRFGTWTSRWRCNYKLILDTFLEAYHVFALHKTTVARYFITAPSTFEPFGPNLRYLSLQKNFPELAQLPEDQWDLDAHATIEYFIAPNTILSHSIDHLAVYRFLPQAVDDTISEMTVYTPAPVTTDEGRTHYDRTIELHKKVSGGEDFITQERIQRSLASGMVAETIFGRNEPAAIHFHEQLRALLAD